MTFTCTRKPKKNIWLTLLWYSLYCYDLEANPHYLWATPMLFQPLAHWLLPLCFTPLISRLFPWAYKTAQFSSILSHNTSSLHPTTHSNYRHLFSISFTVDLTEGYFSHIPSTPLDLLKKIWILLPPSLKNLLIMNFNSPSLPSLFESV